MKPRSPCKQSKLPLHHAAGRGFAVEEFCKLGRAGLTIDDVSAREVLKLLKAGARANERDDDNQTALHLAADTGRLKTVRTLLRFHADPTIKCRCAGMSPLHQALGHGQMHVVPTLLRAGARFEPKSKGARKALFMAVAHGEYKAVRLLLLHGVNPNSRDERGATPMHYAICEEPWDDKSLRTVRELLCFGANPYLRDKKGRSVGEWLQAIQYEGRDPITNSPLDAKMYRELEAGYRRKRALLAVCSGLFPDSVQIPRRRRSKRELKREDELYGNIDISKLASPSPKRVREIKQAARNTQKALEWARQYLKKVDLGK